MKKLKVDEVICIVIFSDVHAEARRLQEFLDFTKTWNFEEQYGKVDHYVCLGDVLDRGHQPKATLNILKGLKELRWVRGNHDEAAQMRVSVCSQDELATAAHAQLIRDGGADFVDELPDYIVDATYKYFAVHGGPVDPSSLAPQMLHPDIVWLSQRTWQRISTYTGFDGSGYHVSPETAFRHASKYFHGDGWMVLAGHDHNEGCYTWDRDKVRDIMPVISRRDNVVHTKIAGYNVSEKHIKIDDKKDYILRIGALGAERPGYYGVIKIDGDRREFIFARMRKVGELSP